MSDVVIRAEGLSKRYTIRHQRTSGDGLRHALQDVATAPFRWLKGQRRPHEVSAPAPPKQEAFWALKDVSFDVARGEVLGIIGRNGAGKSTLLKVLSQITEPTEGNLRIKGRIASLLEVGTGFHPELTGRENVYLNGAILGMARSEVRRKFDEIVAFAEVEQFLDTPVKRYSSGMYLRLAFAIAAHLEPEILIVDEVLAVGDAEFQAKCLGKMQEVSKASGRTVLFVSHNLKAVEGLCDRVAVLRDGSLSYCGLVQEGISKYLESGGRQREVLHVSSPELVWQGVANRRDLDGGSPADDLTFHLAFQVGPRDIRNLEVDCIVTKPDSTVVIHGKSKWVSPNWDVPAHSRLDVAYTFQSPKLSSGEYALTVFAIAGGEVIFWAEGIDGCRISARPYFGIASTVHENKGVILPPYAIAFRCIEPSDASGSVVDGSQERRTRGA